MGNTKQLLHSRHESPSFLHQALVPLVRQTAHARVHDVGRVHADPAQLRSCAFLSAVYLRTGRTRSEDGQPCLK